MNIFSDYIIPAFFGLLGIGGIVLKILSLSDGDWRPVRIFLWFFFFAFGPSLVYAAWEDESSLPLYAASVALAFVVCVPMVLKVVRTLPSGEPRPRQPEE